MTKVMQEEMAEPSGAWVPNLINWFIGTIQMVIWVYIGAFLGIFGMWQMSLDAILAIPEAWGPGKIDSAYLNDLTYEV